jgi:ABC-type dipeptide/oligopeptide/nickel transport system permease subunit
MDSKELATPGHPTVAVAGPVDRPNGRGSGTRRRRWGGPTNWKIRIGLFLLVPMVLVAIFGRWLAPYPYAELNAGEILAGPSAEHPLGTDFFGRDMLSRLIEGASAALVLPLAVAAITLLVAVPIGLLVGYLGGRLDDALMGLADLLLALPWILVALIVVSLRGPGLDSVIIALPIVFAAPVVRITRNSVRSVLNMEYVEAARAIGEPHLSVVLRYILRNAYFPILVLVTSQMGYSILAESAMSYLGFGAQSPDTTWGLELASGADYMTLAPHLVIYPGIAIAWAVMAFSFLGDGFGDLLDATNEES